MQSTEREWIARVAARNALMQQGVPFAEATARGSLAAEAVLYALDNGMCRITGWSPAPVSPEPGEGEDMRLRDGLAAAYTQLSEGDAAGAGRIAEAVLAGGDVPPMFAAGESNRRELTTPAPVDGDGLTELLTSDETISVACSAWLRRANETGMLSKRLGSVLAAVAARLSSREGGGNAVS